MQAAELTKISKKFSYTNYKELVLSYADNKACSGEHTQEHIDATTINAQRMKRIDKQCVISNELTTIINSISKPYTWLLITESWCGDGAQCIPVVAKMAELSSNIKLDIIFRDENLEIMDSFLTNGSRAIPKLIFIQNEQVVRSWGPRPKAIQAMVTEYKKQNPDATHDEFVNNLHLWYARDKTTAIQNEFSEILTQL